MNRYDAIVIGAGANGLATAALLARKLDRVLVLERRDMAGGTNATEEFHPGFRTNACREDAGWLPDSLVRQLALQRQGLQWLAPTAGLVSISTNHPPVATYPDRSRTVDGLKALSPADAGRWPDFTAFVGRAAGFLEAAYRLRAPNVQSRAFGDLMALAGLGRRLRKLGRREMMGVLRVVPMPVADLAEEWFTAEPIRAMLAVAGTRDVMHGPLSGGTALVFLHQQVGQAAGSIGVRRAARGGLGALTAALAAAGREEGVEIRLAAEVSEVVVDGGRVRGVRLSTGEELAATHVVSSADPRRSFSWIDPGWLDPELLRAVDNIRMRGSTARIHFALDALPRVVSGGQEVPRDALGGTLVVAASPLAVERAYDAAKFGHLPDAPALTVTVPSLADSSLAPDRKHVLTVTVHHAPYALEGGWTPAATAALADRVGSSLAPVIPDLAEKTLHRWILTPADLETRYGCTEGNLSHGEIALDQFLFMRPLPASSRYATPVSGFWLCGTGTHPASASGAGASLVSREVLAARAPASG
ncbi:MAG TPA: NAD(P)/FAD-dependent oxidoreductase [Gemmatimonadaceae bacterium]